MRPRIEEDPHRPGEGCARLVLPGMAGREAPFVTFTREGFGADSLGPDGWQVAAGRLPPLESGAEGDDLVLVLGPEAAEHLEPGPVRLGIPALGIDQVVVWPEIAPAQSGKRGGFGANRPGQAQPRRMPGRAAAAPPKPVESDATVVLRAAPRVEPPPPPRPLDPPPIRPPEAPAQPSRLPLILLALILLAGGGAAAWWFWPAPDAPVVAAAPPTPAPPAAPPADPTANATPAEIAAMNLPPARVLEIGRARQANRPQDALLLIELAAEAGHAPALSALARLYDPATFTPGGALSAANPTKAAELWRRAEQAGDAGAAAPRAVLRQRLEAAARNGDTLAQLALRDFWP
ncbi:SEL1-like repeat protein [Falsiroseomonas stagni]|uniref:Sel1 repeat-containing protein n=1 Tax=Falsiroseomonas stagni DSM 19981 TaxID=1123062 RepID=A0A1I4B655_9PROT|nr:hypothetical protein [Falsiroseomonas stagni]SFK64265.1 hypothetical protein SAMN02745775_1056 [Falsiroseomonas stagni DSM 19981]